jgi:tetratricopeptide (TPR) repeat protein
MINGRFTRSIVKAAARPPHSIVRAAALTLAMATWLPAQIPTLPVEGPSDTSFSGELASLEMEAGRRVELESALTHQDYKRAEAMLVEEAEREPKSTRAAKALALAGGIFFLDAQYLNSAIAWKKAEAITPLDERSRFSLAMAYIKLNHREWARPELEKLAAAQPGNALYLYWLSRLDYDAKNYSAAIARLQRVVELDPKMTRGYDTLGLCYDYLGQFDDAIKSYDRAIELNRLQAKPSPWPHVDLAASLIWVNRLDEAEKNLREALTYDPRLPQAHYQLGRVLEMRDALEAATAELNEAAALNPAYPEPHLLLGRIYNRLQQPEKAKAEIASFHKLKKAAESGPSDEHDTSPPAPK